MLGLPPVPPVLATEQALSDINVAQRALHPEIDACMEQLVHRRPSFEAGTTFQVDVDATGAARAVRLVADDVNDHVYGDCVSAVLRRVAWPTPKRKRATFAVRYTIRSTVPGAQPIADFHMRSGWGDLFKPIPNDDYTASQLLDAQQPLHPAVVACMGQLLTRRPKRNGVTTFDVAVDAAGATQGVRVSADDTGDATYTSCMTQVISSGRWPAPRRGRPTRFDLEYQVMGDPSRPPAP